MSARSVITTAVYCGGGDKAGGGRWEGGQAVNETVRAALKQLLSALEAASDAEGNTTAELNAYFVMEQEIQNAASHFAQSLHWARKKEEKHHV